MIYLRRFWLWLKFIAKARACVKGMRVEFDSRLLSITEANQRDRSNFELSISLLQQRYDIESAARMALELDMKMLRSKLATFHVEQYQPPKPMEPERKIIKTRNMREFNAIRDQELEKEEAANAPG